MVLLRRRTRLLLPQLLLAFLLSLSLQHKNNVLVTANEPCNVCGENGVMEADEQAQHQEQPCSFWQNLGDTGQFDATACEGIQNSDIFTNCNCRVVTPPPTPAPTPAPVWFDLTGRVQLVLLNVTDVMSPSIKAGYQNDLRDFFGTWFQNETEWPGKLKQWTVTVDSQQFLVKEETSRRLAASAKQQSAPKSTSSSSSASRHRSLVQAAVAPLITRLTVTAKGTQSLGTSNFEASLQDTLNGREAELIVMIREAPTVVGAVFFKPLTTTETFGHDEPVTTEPGTRTAPNVGTPNEGGGEDSGLDTRTIAGIAAACGFVLILVVGILCVACRPKDEIDKEYEKSAEFRQSLSRSFNSTSPNERALGASFASGMSGSVGASGRYRSRNLGAPRSSSTRIVSADGRTLSILQGTPGSSEFIFKDSSTNLMVDEDPETAPDPYGRGRAKSDDNVSGGGNSLFNDESAIPEEGEHEESEPFHQQTTQQARGGGGGVYDTDDEGPREVFHEEGDDGNNSNIMSPNHSVPAYNDDHDVSEPTDTNSYQERSHANDTFGGSLEESKAEQAAPLPPPQHHQAPSPVPSNSGAQEVWVSREVVAPPGKLGIVIETTWEGPLVHKINANSPLTGIVFEGDLISEIDGVGCEKMNASAITAIMVRTAEQHRRMVVQSKEWR